MNISALMPRPFSRFHGMYMTRYREVRRFDKSSSARIVGCDNGRIVPALHRNGTVFSIRLEVDELPDNGSGKLLFCARLIYAGQESERHQDPRAFCMRVSVGGKVGPSTQDTEAATLRSTTGGRAEPSERHHRHSAGAPKSLLITHVSETAEAIVNMPPASLVGTYLEEILEESRGGNGAMPRKLEEARTPASPSRGGSDMLFSRSPPLMTIIL